MDSNDRITIRLDQDILARMDALLEVDSGFGSRSQLCRIAVGRLLESIEGSTTRVTVEIPRAYLDFIDSLVTRGYFLSREEAVQHLVKEGLSEDGVRHIIEHQETMGKASGKMFPVELREQDPVKRK